MSIRLMSKAFAVQLPASQKLVLLVMCDYANDDGLSCYPSVAQVAIKASLSVRQCRRVLGLLSDMGYISVIANKQGGCPGTTRHYRIDIKKLETGDTSDTGDILSRGTPVVETGDTSGKRRGTPMSPYPSVNHQEPPIKNERKKSRPVKTNLITVPDWLDSELWQQWVDDRKARRKPITPNAAKLSIKKLDEYREQGFSPQEVIENSIANGYQGLFPPSGGKNNGRAGQSGKKLSHADDVREQAKRNLEALDRRDREANNGAIPADGDFIPGESQRLQNSEW